MSTADKHPTIRQSVRHSDKSDKQGSVDGPPDAVRALRALAAAANGRRLRVRTLRPRVLSSRLCRLQLGARAGGAALPVLCAASLARSSEVWRGDISGEGAARHTHRPLRPCAPTHTHSPSAHTATTMAPVVCGTASMRPTPRVHRRAALRVPDPSDSPHAAHHRHHRLSERAQASAYAVIISVEMVYGKHVAGQLHFASLWGPTLYTNTFSALPISAIGQGPRARHLPTTS
jgi:hypothetical protein